MLELDIADIERLQISARCISAHQSYLCYILYEIADNDFIDCILE